MSTKIQKLTPIITPDPSLVLDLDFDTISGNTIHDRSRYNNHGTIYGATPGSENGQGNLNFDGVDDYVDCGNDPSLEIKNDITLMCVAKIIDFSDYNMLITKTTSNGGTQNTYELRIDKTSGYIHFLQYTTELTSMITTIPITLNKKEHITITKKETLTKCYLNTKLIKESTFGTSSSGTNNVKIGTRDDLNNFSKGSIFSVKIFNKALTEQQIKKYYLQSLR